VSIIILDIKLKKIVPSLAEIPSKELEALKERAIKIEFDFIEFWAVDFEYQGGQPFEHHWQSYCTWKDCSLPIISYREYDNIQKRGNTLPALK
jgi:adenine-specific DNA-methyltransferase